MSADVLSQVSLESSLGEQNIQKFNLSNLLERCKEIHNDMTRRVSQLGSETVYTQIFQAYHKKVQELIGTLKVESNSMGQKRDLSRKSSLQEIETQQSLQSMQQHQYMFLRNVWQGKNSQNSESLYDAEDHIDRISKVVAIIKQQTIYMTRKENYRYEKQESNNQYVYQNPLFIRVKEELQRARMENEQLREKLREQNINKLQVIEKLKREKILLQNSLRSLKKKLQQMQKSWIQVSKKNICLQQESLIMKSHNSKSRLNLMRESGEWEMRGSLTQTKIKQQSKTILSPHPNQTETHQLVKQPQSSTPLDNVFIDIRLQSNRDSKPSNRYSKLHQQNYQSKECLKDVTESVNSPNFELQLSHLDQVVTETSPFKFRNLRNQTSSRKTLLSSARSAEILEKTSLNKPKFERTKPNTQIIIKSMLKAASINDNGLEKSSILKSHLMQGEETSSLIKSFRKEPRSFAACREVVK